MSHFEEVKKCVQKYFRDSLDQGYTIPEIAASFGQNPLPQDLLQCGFEDAELRRLGQQVSTQYLIQHMEAQSAQLPETDLVQTTHE